MILMYHHISPLDEIPSDPILWRNQGWQFHTLPESLHAQIIYLKKRRYTILPFSEYVDEIKKRGVAPRDAVAITFDDGWRDNPRHALPVLVATGVSAIFFLVSGAFESVGRGALATESEVRILLSAGMEIGTHTRTHRPLGALTLAELRDEVLGSCQDLTTRFGVPIRHLAYPGGNFNRAVVDWIASESGLVSAAGSLPSMQNRQENLFFLSRETIREPWNFFARRKLTNPGWRVYQSARNLAKLKTKLR